jgi:NADH dehydrogenase
VELAGAIADLARTVLVHDFRRIHPESARIVLIEASPHVLGAFGEDLAEKARRDLENLGVEVRTGSRVTAIDENGVDTTSGRIVSRSVFWAAGVQAAPLEIEEAVERDRAGRLKVDRDLSIPGYPNAFVVGDMAAAESPDGKPVPGLAPAAIQAGRHAAENIVRRIHGETPEPFVYRDKGQMATIGKHKAVAMIGSLTFTGYFAWVVWLLVHVLFLVGFKNRIGVLFDWTWNYLFTKRGSRLITSSRWQLERGSRPN